MNKEKGRPKMDKGEIINHENDGRCNVKRFHVTHEETVNASAKETFALACPVEELKWIDKWQFQMIYSDSGRNENNCIFREEMSGLFVLNLPEIATYWYTTLYDKQGYRFHAVLVSGEVAIGKFEFEMETMSAKKVRACWSLTFTSLGEDGNRLFDEGFKGRMKGMLTFLGASAKHYLEKSEMLRMGDA